MSNKKTLHFVYTVPRGNIFYRAFLKLLIILKLPPPYRYGINFFIPWKHPVRAPHSISFHLLNELKKHFNVRFYGIYEHTVCNTLPGDIVLAQPAPITKDNPPKYIDKESVTYRTFYEKKDIIKIIIMPYSNDNFYTAWWKDLVKDHGKYCLFFAGQIWFDRWNESPFKNLPIIKRHRLNMGLDLKDYPRVKKVYNEKNKRGVLYIGHTSWYKNTIELEKIAEKMPNIKFGHIGGGNIKGWDKIADFADLTPEFMSNISKDYDIFLNVSTADPQVTTVLENMAFGFLVGCTSESGYEFPSLFKMSTNNTDFNISQIKKMQEIDDNEINKIYEQNMEVIRKQYLWPGVEGDVINFVNDIILENEKN